MGIEIVSAYFRKTLGRSNVRVVEVARLQNPELYSRYLRDTGETLMFHGCRSMENEDSISKNGFQVSCCRSGGQNYGSWFAYNASYSDGGYAFTDGSGIKHLFVCAVSRQNVVRNDSVMRVVGQDCAYPLWIIKYRDFSWASMRDRSHRPFAHEVFDVLEDRARYGCWSDDDDTSCYGYSSANSAYGDYYDDNSDSDDYTDDFFHGSDAYTSPGGMESFFADYDSPLLRMGKPRKTSTATRKDCRRRCGVALFSV